MNFKERLDKFPTQLWLTILWGGPITALALFTPLGSSILFISLISLYAIAITHWGAHLAWKAERAAEKTSEPSFAKRTDESD